MDLKKKEAVFDSRDNNFAKEQIVDEAAKAFEGMSLSEVSGIVAELTASQTETLTELQDLERSHWLIRRRFNEEFGALRESYEKQYAPLYQKRAEILGKKKENLPNEDLENITSIPNFWFRALTNCVAVSSIIERDDVQILRYLSDIQFDFLGNAFDESFELRFHFAENPFFENSVLTKKIWMFSMKELEERSPKKNIDWIIEGKYTEGDEIVWKPGKDVTKKNVTRRQKNKRTNEKRVFEYTMENPSFFRFFGSKERPEVDPNADEDDPEFMELMDFESEIQIALKIRDRIIPNAVAYYLDEADTESIYSDSDEEGDEDSTVADDD